MMQNVNRLLCKEFVCNFVIMEIFQGRWR